MRKRIDPDHVDVNVTAQIQPAIRAIIDQLAGGPNISCGGREGGRSAWLRNLIHEELTRQGYDLNRILRLPTPGDPPMTSAEHELRQHLRHCRERVRRIYDQYSPKGLNEVYRKMNELEREAAAKQVRGWYLLKDVPTLHCYEKGKSLCGFRHMHGIDLLDMRAIDPLQSCHRQCRQCLRFHGKRRLTR